MSRPPTHLVLGAALLLATLAVWWPATSNGFVDYDDPAYVTANPRVQDGPTVDGLRWALTARTASNWHPLTWLSHMLDCRLHGLDPRGHHLSSVFCHALAAVLLYGALGRLTGGWWSSALAAALFALHPLRTESVAWVAERKDVLSGALGFACLLAWSRYLERPAPGRYVAPLALHALALAAKPMLVTLPCLLLLLDLWPARRLGRGPARLVLEKLPFLALSAASSWLTWQAQHAGNATVDLAAYPVGVRVSNAAVSCVAYLGQALWPAGLVVFYPHPEARIDPTRVALAAAGLALATALALAAARRRPWWTVGWLWYLGTLVPVIGLVQVGAQARADRYTYLPLVGLAWALAWEAAALARRGLAARAAVAAASLAALAALVPLTHAQVAVWRDTGTLFRHALAATEENWLAHNALGDHLRKEDRLDEAAGEFRAALVVWPLYAEAHNNLGGVLALQGRLDEAAAHLGEAVRIKPRYADAHSNLGVVLASLGRRDEAERHLREALTLDPDHERARTQLERLRGP
ncbi:MAG: tetratricopeptide repeat protein [Planctomycetes bacterium]|nr:tetratricopeptide repeat protein [Planctomycetota bacterium]